MREIKFRAWIPKAMTDGTPMMFYQNGQYLSSFLRRANQFASGFGHDKYSEDNLILLEYTGLKDKNGKEIWEGDVVQFQSPHHSLAVPSGIQYGCICWGRTYGFVGFTLRSGVDKGYHYAFENDKLEVIGNIYENPELLTK